MPQLFEYSGKTRQQTPQAGNIHSGSHWNLYVETDCVTCLWSHIPLNPRIGSYFCSAFCDFFGKVRPSQRIQIKLHSGGGKPVSLLSPMFSYVLQSLKKKSLTPPGANDRRIITSMLAKKTPPTSAHVLDDFLKIMATFKTSLKKQIFSETTFWVCDHFQIQPMFWGFDFNFCSKMMATSPFTWFFIWACGHGRSWTFHCEPTVPVESKNRKGMSKLQNDVERIYIDYIHIQYIYNIDFL